MEDNFEKRFNARMAENFMEWEEDYKKSKISELRLLLVNDIKDEYE
jgi:hypothetical protein